MLNAHAKGKFHENFIIRSWFIISVYITGQNTHTYTQPSVQVNVCKKGILRIYLGI